MHPANPELGDETGLFIGLHYAQLFLIGGLAYMFWLLVERLEGRGARAARILILPFVIVYTAVDAVLGIAWGTVVQEANALPAADQAAAGRLIDNLLSPLRSELSSTSVQACSGLPSWLRSWRHSGGSGRGLLSCS